MSQKTYVISSFQATQSDKHAEKAGRDSERGAPNKALLKGMLKYCDYHDAELMLLSMNGMNKAESNPELTHPYFIAHHEEQILHPSDRNVRLNSNIMISDDVVPPQNMDPTTSRDRLVKGTLSRVYAHPKQRLKTVPTGNRKFPKILMTTGACSFPNYDKTNHRGDMASKEHRYGFGVVDIIDDKYYNVRIVPAQRNGLFIDLGKVYKGNRQAGKAKVENLVLGDIHWGDHDLETIAANDEMIQYFNPKRVILHDFVNGHSVNPHEMKNTTLRAREFARGRLSMQHEFAESYQELMRLARKSPQTEFVLPADNHGYFFNRYINDGIFLKEPFNTEFGAKIMNKMMEGYSAVEAGMRLTGKIPKNVRFLRSGDDLISWGTQFANHGHRGNSGTRGSVKSMEIAYSKSVSGHTHAPEIMRDTYVVGTSSRLDLPYTSGGGTKWMAANAVQYEGGLIQLLPIIDGKWMNRARRKLYKTDF